MVVRKKKGLKKHKMKFMQGGCSCDSEYPETEDSSWASDNYNGGSCDPLSSDEDQLEYVCGSQDIESAKQPCHIAYGDDGPLDFNYQYDAWELALDDAHDKAMNFDIKLGEQIYPSPASEEGARERLVDQNLKQIVPPPGSGEGAGEHLVEMQQDDTPGGETWVEVCNRRRGGKVPLPPVATSKIRECTCTQRTNEYFCQAAKCRNHQCARPLGSMTACRPH